MKPRQVVLLLLIVLLPLSALGWFGIRASRSEADALRHQFQDVLRSKLQDTDDEIVRLFQQRERTLTQMIDESHFPSLSKSSGSLSSDDVESLREIARDNALVSAMLVLSPDGKLLYPLPSALDGNLNASEREFLNRARQPLLNKEFLQANSESNTLSKRKSWHIWFWDNGINLVFCHKTQSGHIIGAELDHARLKADIIARLPDTKSGASDVLNGSIGLLDSNGAVVYQWGNYQPQEKELPSVELPLSAPLASWRLNYFLSATEFDSALKGHWAFSYISAFLAIGLALFGLVFYFYKEHSRDVRDAEQRVNFVSRVSHELKTPLTNIRMYAELLERQYEDSSSCKTKSYLNVIVSESQRLSRLIGNVLLFGRQEKKIHTLYCSKGIIDESVSAILDQFRPSLELKGIEISTQLHAPSPVEFDADALGQILGNLLGNVEKYAAAGKWLAVATLQQNETVEITVSDKGNGIDKTYREKIFEPFFRINHSLSEGVSGTGIGLTIARDLARQHGGDLLLDESYTTGARFCLRLKVARDC